MADRVLFATTQDTITPANCSGFNCFPFPFTIAAPDYNHPIAVSLDDCVKWFWRVKNWAITTDAAIVDTDGNPWSFSSGVMVPGASNPTTESGHLDPLLSLGFSRSGTNYDFTFGIGGIVQDSGFLYPGIFNGIPGTVGSDAAKGILEFSPVLGGLGLPTITGTMDGYSIPIYYDATSFPPTSFTFTSFDLSPAEYWPYANSGGLPIWDTITGAQLRDPAG